jgi:hypothetical protein
VARKRRGDAEAATRPIADKIAEYQQREDHLMRMATAMQQEAMGLYAEIAVLKQARNFAWQTVQQGAPQ